MNQNVEKEIINLINNYGKMHELALTEGSEYILQNNRAYSDAIYLVGRIFDKIAKSNNQK